MSNDAVKDHLLCAFLDEELSHEDVDSLLELLECDDARARASRQSLAGSVMANQKTLCVDISASVREAIAQEEPLMRQTAAPQKRRRLGRAWFAAPSQTVGVSRRSRRRWQVPAAGVALAASVALAAVVVVRPVDDAGQAATQQIAALQSEQNPALNNESLLAQAPASQSSSPVRAPVNSRLSGAQLVSAGRAGTRNAGRELVIAAPEQSRPVSAQWALVREQSVPSQQLASQQRVREQLNTYLINHARHGGGAALTGSLAYARVAARPAQTQASK